MNTSKYIVAKRLLLLSAAVVLTAIPWATVAYGQNSETAPRVAITEKGDYRYITANGLPDHETGAFPNRRNPNTITAQNYNFRVPLSPAKAGRITTFGLRPFGVAINGVIFDPVANEYWNRDRASGWNYDALSGALDLGFDRNNAHVHPSGSYHYHGLPTGILEQLSYKTQPALIGYAADGFPIYGPWGYADPGDNASGMTELRSSFRIRSGTRPGGPGGGFDGSFVEDYEYIAGLGDLDACNGRDGVTPEYPEGTYYYVITEEFPNIPRCFTGQPDRSFERRGPGSGIGAVAGGPARQGPPRGGGRHPDLNKAARVLGVPLENLRRALGPPPPDLRRAAATLGVDVATLRQALGR